LDGFARRGGDGDDPVEAGAAEQPDQDGPAAGDGDVPAEVSGSADAADEGESTKVTLDRSITTCVEGATSARAWRNWQTVKLSTSPVARQTTTEVPGSFSRSMVNMATSLISSSSSC
jgi:hypothetical protein